VLPAEIVQRALTLSVVSVEVVLQMQVRSPSKELYMISSTASAYIQMLSITGQDLPSATTKERSPNANQSLSYRSTLPIARPASAQYSSPGPARPAPVEVKTLPTDYQFCNLEDLVVLIGRKFSDLIQKNEQIPLRDRDLTRFHSRFVA
jgi:hypothetical protein